MNRVRQHGWRLKCLKVNCDQIQFFLLQRNQSSVLILQVTNTPKSAMYFLLELSFGKCWRDGKCCVVTCTATWVVCLCMFAYVGMFSVDDPMTKSVATFIALCGLSIEVGVCLLMQMSSAYRFLLQCQQKSKLILVCRYSAAKYSRMSSHFGDINDKMLGKTSRRPTQNDLRCQSSGTSVDLCQGIWSAGSMETFQSEYFSITVHWG